MAWIAVDDSRREWVCSSMPDRMLSTWNINPTERSGDMVEVPKGTAYKLTGKQLTWDDEPVELKEEKK